MTSVLNNGLPLACKFCFKLQDNLSVHLWRECRRSAEESDIASWVEEAQLKMNTLVRKLSVVRYEDLDGMKEFTDPRDFFQQFLEKNGCYVTGKPAPTQRSKLPSITRKTSQEYRWLLSAAKPAFLQKIQKAKCGSPLEEKEKLIILHFLKAVVIFKDPEISGVFLNMTIREWLERQHTYQDNDKKIKVASVTVETPGTADRQVSTLILQEDEEMWFNVYFTKVRPTFQTRDSRNFPLFFISTTEGKVASQDLPKIHLKVVEEKQIEKEKNPALLMLQKNEDLKKLKGKFPVTLEQKSPSLKQCFAFSPLYGRYCYEEWRKTQNKMRTENIIANFQYNKPDKQQIKAYIELQGWQQNVPRAADIIASWKPQTTWRQQPSNRVIEYLIRSQTWNGLAIVMDRDKGGQKLVATKPFLKGEIVCDYHGRLLTHEEGEEMMTQMRRSEMGYLIFFKDKTGKRWCIDGKTAPCRCHPYLLSSFGRAMKHSRKENNVKPAVYYMENDKSPTLLFVANKHIGFGDELRFDYGVLTRTFGGEVADYTWSKE